VQLYPLQPVPRKVHGDGCEPGCEFRIAPELFNVPVGRYKSVLHHFARLVIVSDKPIGDVQHPFLVLCHELFKRQGHLAETADEPASSSAGGSGPLL
jgi:hypothetical protein